MADGLLNPPDVARFQTLLKEVPLPTWTRVKQAFPTEKVGDVAAAVRQELTRPEIARHLKPGARVAVGVGSRGLASLFELVETSIVVLREAGCEPFIVPAMGSHGGATAEGQEKLLAGYGITKERLGVEIRSSLATVTLEHLPNGLPVYFSKEALEADLILPINRVKSHTSFRGDFESGITKMLVIGFAKHVGAQAVHALGWERFFNSVRDARDVLLAHIPFAFGLATVENAYGQVMRVEAIAKANLEPRERDLLKLSKANMARLYFDTLDVLTVFESGKNISGLGLDPNVTGRFASSITGDLEAARVVLLNLTDKTQGNAIGMGLADITTERVARNADLTASWLNAITSTSLIAAKLPIFMATDRLAVQLALKTCGQPDPKMTRAVLIKNSSSLDEIFVSDALLQEVEAHPQLSISEGKVPAFIGDRLEWV